MGENAYRTVEVIASSHKGSEDAVIQAFADGQFDQHNVAWFEIIETRGHIVDGRVDEYRVRLKIGYRVN